jgi:hypothetical protein
MRPRKLPTIHLPFPGVNRVPWWRRRHWVLCPRFWLETSMNSAIPRVMESTRRRARARGWSEEEINEIYPRAVIRQEKRRARRERERRAMIGIDDRRPQAMGGPYDRGTGWMHRR